MPLERPRKGPGRPPYRPELKIDEGERVPFRWLPAGIWFRFTGLWGTEPNLTFKKTSGDKYREVDTVSGRAFGRYVTMHDVGLTIEIVRIPAHKRAEMGERPGGSQT